MTERGRSWPSTPAPVRSTPWSASRRSTPVPCPPTTRRDRHQDAARRRPGEAPAVPGLPGDLLPRLDVQGRHRRRGRRAQPGAGRLRRRHHLRHRLHRRRPGQLRRRHVRRQPRRDPPGVVQHRLRPDGRRPRVGQPGRDGQRLRVQRGDPDRPAQPGRVGDPRDLPHRPGQRSPGPSLDRPGRRPGQPAPDGPRRRRVGQRRLGDDAPRHGPGHRPGRRGDPGLRGHRVAPGGLRRRRRRGPRRA